jgi:dTDP-4-amino-4,6-dideoxygalactose transaminase
MPDLAIRGGPEAAAALDVPDWPRLTDRAREYVLDSLESGHWCRNAGGEYAERFEERFADYHDAEHCVAVSNGTVAIELALRACGVQPGDEVLVPSYSFIASAAAVPAVGAVPRFVDTDPETYNLDPAHLRAAITDRTVGVVGVHFAGYPMDMDEIPEICRENDLFLLEDSAHAQGTAWRGERVGALGDVGTFSFQESKSLPAGEGGAIVTDDDVLAERARLYHNVGRAQGATGYRHYHLATNGRMPEYAAAIALANLGDLDEQNARRQDNEARLRERLAGIEGIRCKPEDDRITDRGYCLFDVRYDGPADRDAVIEALRAEGVPCSDGYECPIYRYPAFSREEMARVVPDAVSLPDYRNLHLPGAERVVAENVSMSHRVLLADPAGVDALADSDEMVVAAAAAGDLCDSAGSATDDSDRDRGGS